jgi:Fe-S oxidoreductase
MMPLELHIPCITSHFFPKTAENIKKLCEFAGLNFILNENATCCGMPFFEKGELKSAKLVGEYNLKTINNNALVCVSPKCHLSYSHHYPKIFNNTVSHNSAVAVSKNISGLEDVIKRLNAEQLAQMSGSYFIVQECCQTYSSMKMFPESETLKWSKPKMSVYCCGAGTSFPSTGSKISHEMALGLIHEFQESGAQAMVFEDDICRKHIHNVAEKEKISINSANIIDLIVNCL